MPSPHAAPRVFRYQFLRIWRMQTTLSTLGVVGGMTLFAWWLDAPIIRPSMLTTAFSAVFCALCLAPVAALARFTVDADGLRTFDTWGRWQHVPWGHISAARPARYYFLPHLRLAVDGRTSALWVPLFLRDMNGFRDAVLSAAGAEHPLAQALPVEARAAVRRPAS